MNEAVRAGATVQQLGELRALFAAFADAENRIGTTAAATPSSSSRGWLTAAVAGAATAVILLAKVVRK